MTTYRIIKTPSYYAGTLGAPSEGFVKKREIDEDSESHETAWFDTREEAQAVVDDLNSGTYYHSHGEAGRPTYEIVDEDWTPDGDCLDASNEHFGGYELIDANDVPTDVYDRLIDTNVEWYSSGDDYDIYTACDEDENDEDRQYMIVFCPRTIAIDIAEGDLSNLDWDNEAFFRET